MPKKYHTNLKSKKLTVPEIIDYCKTNLGLTFNLISEEDAKIFFKNTIIFFV